MIKQIVKDTMFLSIPSKQASEEDIIIGYDLIDTLKAHQDKCVGMAANMIGINKNIIIVSMGFNAVVMFNPKYIHRINPYSIQEGCLSLNGVRNTIRYQLIEIEYFDMQWKKHREKFSGDIAQIIQHEMDHCKGILI